jgi:putative nucleotidyltransferase with HDIG domain
LHPQSIINFDLYLKIDRNYILFRHRNLRIDLADIQRLLENSTETLYIHNNDRKNYRSYLEANIDSVLKASDVPVARKAEVLYESAINVVEDVFENPRSGEVSQRSKQMVGNTVDFILSGPQAFVSLLKIREHDFYTFTHSVNVCTFLVALAQNLGIADPAQLRAIGEGGLLHDLGKSKISATIINKRGPLTNSEWEVMKQHPAYGVEIAKAAHHVSDTALTIIGQHHEKLSGKGYPQALSGRELSVYARMASIVDVYDAVTTSRSYSVARSPLEGAQILLSRREDYDEQILRRFIKMIAVK